MTAWERLLGEPTLRPLGSPCRICGNDPEQRHRVWDALTDRWQAGESLVEVAALVQQTGQLGALDSDGVLDGDGGLVLGLVCELSDRCLFEWRSA